MIGVAALHLAVAGIPAAAILAGRAARGGAPGARLAGSLAILAAFEISYPLPMIVAASRLVEDSPETAVFGLACAVVAQPVGVALAVRATAVRGRSDSEA